MCAYMIAACRPRRPIGTAIQPYDQDDKRRVSNWEFIPNIMDRSHAMRFHAESCAVLRCVPLSTWLYTAPCCTLLCLLVLTTTVHWYITYRSQLMAKCTQRNNSDKPEIYQRQRQVFFANNRHTYVTTTRRTVQWIVKNRWIRNKHWQKWIMFYDSLTTNSRAAWPQLW